jgi:hypothetical protein
MMLLTSRSSGKIGLFSTGRLLPCRDLKNNGDGMNKQFWKQFAIALGLFLLGYFTFNSNLFS